MRLPMPNEYYLMDPEQPAACPHCGRRLDASDEPWDYDEDGPIYEGACPVHGVLFFQLDEQEGRQ